MSSRLLLALLACPLAACANPTSSGDTDADGTDDGVADDGVADDGADGGPVDDGADDGSDDTGGPAPQALGSCSYESPFTGSAECREYIGDGWTESTLQTECDGLSGELSMGEDCPREGSIGVCVLEEDPDRIINVIAYGDASGCSLQATGCETFGGGTWEPAEICDDGTEPTDPPEGNVFIQPTLVCSDPLPGEPAGNSEGGQVCTWQAISGATEEGRRFSDYASCDVVYTQRPYYPAPPAEEADPDDPRLDDPTYAAELSWVYDQIEASACVCCHGNEAPNGASNWTIDADGNWISTFYDSGLAMSAGWVDSTALRCLSRRRTTTASIATWAGGSQSTEPRAHDRDFFRGRARLPRLDVEDDFEDTKRRSAGRSYDQRSLRATEACESGQGIDGDGTLRWDGGGARYVYVLEAGSGNPTVPPNLDLPEGTLWRVDVPADGSPIAAGEVTYGSLPEGTTQRFPAEGEPAPLVPGTEYYLYVTADVGIPITRCLFTF